MKVDKFPIIYFIVTIFTQAVLLALKVSDIIKWDWVFVITPLWAPYLLFILFGVLFCIYLIICDIKGMVKNKHS